MKEGFGSGDTQGKQPQNFSDRQDINIAKRLRFQGYGLLPKFAKGLFHKESHKNSSSARPAYFSKGGIAWKS
jgi:hypothetical protein